MSYEAWRREVAHGTMPEDDGGSRVCGDCWWRMVHAAPTVPHQRCAYGHGLPWYDANDPERGYFDWDDASGGRDA